MKIIALLPLALCVSAATNADVLISQYIEGSSNNKAIELYNTSGNSVDLKDYTLSFYSNGNTSASTVIDLTGSINPGATYVVASQNASSAITGLANQLSGQNFFNGNDAIVLSRSTTVVDSLGQKGVDPGSEWGTGLTSTKDNSLIRLETVSQGDTNPDDPFNPAAQYRGLAKDDFSGLGEHTFSPDDSGGGEEGSLAGVCTNCPDLDKVAAASDFDPASYYAAVQAEINAGSDSAIVRQRLSETLANGHRQLTYDEVWTALTETDEDPANNNNVILFYSNRSIAKSSNGSGTASSNPDNWNREHSWPKSHGFSERNNEAYTDIQHLRATDISVNSSRGSLDFDYSDAPLAEAPENRVDGDSFEPRDAIKGDVARMMMYMDVRYEGNTDVTPDLRLVNYLTAGGDAELGKLCTLLQWHENDPVDASESARADRIYEYQGNRNPFVDHPEWVSLLYSDQACDNSAPAPVEPELQPQSPAAPIMLTAVFDATLRGGVPKGIELLVTRDIDDLSICGVGSANNGGGSDGQEFTFDAVSASAGDYLYLASENDKFLSFFGFAPDYTSGAMSINGDDAIEVFCDDAVVDTYGDINTDGNGEAWEYTNSFAYRTGGAASATFDVAQWNVPGVDTLNNQTTNATATIPIPVGTFSLTPATLFFSEYIEGSGYNKALELVNLGGTDVALADYSIQIFANGNTTPNDLISLSGTLSPGEVFVIANNQADNAILAEADTVTGAISFNGDDAVVLWLKNNIVDAIGQIGVRSNWGSGDTSTKNRTLRRQDGISIGDDNAYDSFDPATEWNGFAQNTFDDLGRYHNGGGNGGGSNELGACYEDAVFIHEVQGDGFSSPRTGESVIIEAVVSHVTPGLSGFFMQEESADYDSNDNTSEGVFVAGNTGELMVGDVVRLKGVVEESYGRTQLVAQGDPLVCANASSSVTPVVLNLPQAFAGEFEAYEGMMVTNQSDWLVNNVYSYGKYGEIQVGSERLFTPTQLFGQGLSKPKILPKVIRWMFC
ncbi:endonuclease [Salinimonas marina]|uniref:Endonuclease n=1 Tax=Salinimonas marina TaxID=2785918 RepID=A0A7S9DWM6_9ALTE|nr:endonuclease [Salinimonas marina]QPG05258.1 endonuclease [Salinimonas marina]